MRDLDPAFGHWLAGFIDGEGSFNIKREGAARGRRGGWSTTFSLAVRDDEWATLEAIRAATGLGAIRAKRSAAGSWPQVSWEVAQTRDQAQLIELLAAHPLRAKKRHDLAVWAKAVAYRQRMPRGRGRGWREGLHSAANFASLQALRRELDAVRAYSPNGALPTLLPPEPEAQTTLDDLWEYDEP
jgi:hypothetical protein